MNPPSELDAWAPLLAAGVGDAPKVVARPHLLVSVRDVAEAETALAAGVAVLDIKDPARGSLGAASPATQAAIIAAVRRNAPGASVTAALGEVHEVMPPSLPPGLDLVKIGFRDAAADPVAPLRCWLDWLAAQSGPPLVVAAYADYEAAGAPPPQRLADLVVQTGAAGLLIDTCIKDGRTLLDHVSRATLAALVCQMRQAGRLVALAGSLRAEDVPAVAALGPSIIAVRGAVCEGGDRGGRIDALRVRELLALFRR